ncbi:CelD/BcsL family acetyltransferase involved in cellulose biosynthesis [Rhizobium subbaraonis]|uniref:CelD/BcsL family acetyltransferase involved in cellulose biosynthesis n=2 Tax=Rhizobium subbaraonis TaxID=908946 RepID=A0A285U1Z1_9HYPH|nr:CelD/BcsL family acetyltransferase involved in cellulose biosynthesis [Rhizobium subbaraonis]
MERMDQTGPVCGALNVSVLTDRAAMEAIADDWRALEQRCEGGLSFFQSYMWCHNWAAHFTGAAGGPRPFVATVWCGGRLVALWPLMQSGVRGALFRMEALGGTHTQYSNIIIDPDFADLAEPIADKLLAALFDAGDFDVALFEGVPDGSALATMMARANSGVTIRNAASLLDLTGFVSADAYVAGLGKLQRRNRNRRRNHLARHGALQFSVLWPDEPAFAPTLYQALQMKRRWLTETGRLGLGLSQPGFGDFLTGLEGDRDSLSGACLSVLKTGERIAAVELGFLHGGHYYCYMGAFDWDLCEASPGKVQMEMTVCWLIDNGIETYDLLANPAGYKESWSNRTVGLSTYTITPSWRGRFYARGWVATARPALKRGLEALAYRLRRLTTLTQGIGCIVLLA